MGKYNEQFYVEEELEKQLLDGEQILWRSKPNFMAFFMNNSMETLFIVMLPYAFAVAVGIFFNLRSEAASTAFLLFSSFFVFFSLLVSVVIFAVWGARREWKHLEYVLTNQRMIICTKGNGYVYTIVSLKEIKMITMRQGGFDKLFNVGDVLVTVNQGKNQGVCRILDIKDWEDFYFLLDEKMEEVKEGVRQEGQKQEPDMLDGLKSIL
ncbi:MAG: PH domain-containing protein [Lachnospiraceae bacterium]|nr:PH domain-containing protein [Lachnospiraceae bacterium]